LLLLTMMAVGDDAIIDDELLNGASVFKERLSQSALVAKMRIVSDADARGADIGLGRVVQLPDEETTRRWQQTTSQWPMVSAISTASRATRSWRGTGPIT
jgi:hypothetical protein